MDSVPSTVGHHLRNHDNASAKRHAPGIAGRQRPISPRARGISGTSSALLPNATNAYMPTAPLAKPGPAENADHVSRKSFAGMATRVRRPIRSSSTQTR